MAIVEHPFPVGAPVAPHLHTREGEYSIVTGSEIGFRSGDRQMVLGPGGDLAERDGLQFGEPEWLPGIVERFGLTT